MTTIRLRGLLAALLVSVALVACGGTATPSSPAASVAPSETAPSASVATEAPTASPSEAPTASPSEAAATPGSSMATTGRIEIPDKGVALTLPDGWTRVDLAAGDLEALLEAAGAADPALAEQYSAQIQAMLAAGLALFALGPDPLAGTNVTMLAIPSMGLSLDLLEQLNVAQVEQMAEGDVKTERVDLPAGEAIHLEYAVPVAGTASGTTIDQYLLVVDDNQIVLTITGATPAEGDAIANSVELLD